MNPEQLQLSKPDGIRVRLAPSPTGFLHIGTARVALFNYLFAKKNQGSFIVRIEDTDQKRSKPEYEKDIIESLNWLGIKPDEAPDKEGGHGPYRQSERKEFYAKYLKKLLEQDKAYYCFCSEEELEAQRQYQLSIGEAPRYSGKCVNLSKETVEKYLAEKKQYVIRFRVPAKKVVFEDLIRGKVEFDASLMGDMVIAKDPSTPLYNFACVVDDFEMKISHVIRGEDHIPNTPKQILLQKALGLSRPKYAHLPLILGPDRRKLSKRHGVVSISDYRKQGYLPETLINFMALLGWNPDTEREIYSMNSLIKEFSLEKVQKSGAVFNIKKLDFLNGFYIRQKSLERLTTACLPYLIEEGLINPVFGERQYPPAYGGKEIVQEYTVSETGKKIGFDLLQKIVSIYQERLKKLSEIPELTDCFFKDKLQYDKDLLRWNKMSDEELKTSLDRLSNVLSEIKPEDFNKNNLGEVLLREAEDFGKQIKKIGDRGYLLWPLRVALTGKKASASPFDIADILGKEKTLKRIKQAKQLIL
ncbi:MAG: glutamate--tRNA ligase [Candidatus Nealsonbacteria bacterium]